MEEAGKRRKIGHGDHDRISSLPEPNLLHILSFLPTKFAVRTSVLSKTWRRLWTYVPTLDFEYQFPLAKHHEERLDTVTSPALLHGIIQDKVRDKKFLDVVNQFLMLRNRTDIHKFRLWYSGSLCAPLDSWFDVARKLNIRELDIGIFKKRGPFNLPLAVFGTKSLNTVKLDLHYSRLRVPSDVGFSHLKILQMLKVKFSPRYFHEEFFSNCPTLESLTLQSCEFVGSAPFKIFSSGLKTLDIYGCLGLEKREMKLRAPNLVTFSYVHSTIAKRYDFTNLVSLVRAKIRILDKEVVNCSSLSQMITGLHSAKDLSICGSSIEMLAAGKDQLPTLPMLQNIEQLNMIAYSCTCSDYRGVIKSYLSQCPNLKKLVFNDFQRKSKHMGGLRCCTPAVDNINLFRRTFLWLTGDMEEADKGKKIEQGDYDRISSLPEPILLHILSFLPTKFAIRTSVLSKAWRHLWTYVPMVDFECQLPLTKKHEEQLDTETSPAVLYDLIEDKERDKKFLDVVNQFLMLRNRTDIHKFRLWYSGSLRAPLDSWFDVARKLNIRELDIGIFKKRGPFNLPSAVFGTKSLNTVKLDLHYSHLRVPSDVGFSHLKILQMLKVKFSPRYFHVEFFSNCPTLESLTLRSCEFVGSAPFKIFSSGLKTLDIYDCLGLEKREMKLRAPKLVTFSYVHSTIANSYEFTNLVSLVHAKVRVLEKEEVNCPSLSQMITGLHSAKVLSLCGSSIEILAAGKDQLPNHPMLQNIEQLNMIVYL